MLDKVAITFLAFSGTASKTSESEMSPPSLAAKAQPTMIMRMNTLITISSDQVNLYHAVFLPTTARNVISVVISPVTISISPSIFATTSMIFVKTFIRSPQTKFIYGILVLPTCCKFYHFSMLCVNQLRFGDLHNKITGNLCVLHKFPVLSIR